MHVAAWQQIYADLRERIVSTAMKPGDPVIESDIALRQGVSRTPVREALLRLADEGLVRIVPKQGSFVAPIPIEALPEAMLVRKALEGMAVRIATKAASNSEILSLAVILEQQREADSANDFARFHAADEAFHRRIAEIAGHPQLWAHVVRTKTQVDRFRRLTLPIPGRMKLVIAEHFAVYESIRSREQAEAVTAIERHLDAVLPALSLRSGKASA